MSPIAHTGLALIGWNYSGNAANRRALLFFLIAANLPDIDFLFVLFAGKSAFAIHQHYTHNLMFTLLTTFLLFPLLHTPRARFALMLTAFSHLVLDLLTLDPAPPFGFRIFYPFSQFYIHFGLLPNLQKGSLTEIISWRNAAVASFELLLFLAPAVLAARGSIQSLIFIKETKPNHE